MTDMNQYMVCCLVHSNDAGTSRPLATKIISSYGHFLNMQHLLTEGTHIFHTTSFTSRLLLQFLWSLAVCSFLSKKLSNTTITVSCYKRSFSSLFVGVCIHCIVNILGRISEMKRSLLTCPTNSSHKIFRCTTMSGSIPACGEVLRSSLL